MAGPLFLSSVARNVTLLAPLVHRLGQQELLYPRGPYCCSTLPACQPSIALSTCGRNTVHWLICSQAASHPTTLIHGGLGTMRHAGFLGESRGTASVDLRPSLVDRRRCVLAAPLDPRPASPRPPTPPRVQYIRGDGKARPRSECVALGHIDAQARQAGPRRFSPRVINAQYRLRGLPRFDGAGHRRSAARRAAVAALRAVTCKSVSGRGASRRRHRPVRFLRSQLARRLRHQRRQPRLHAQDQIADRPRQRHHARPLRPRWSVVRRQRGRGAVLIHLPDSAGGIGSHRLHPDREAFSP